PQSKAKDSDSAQLTISNPRPYTVYSLWDPFSSSAPRVIPRAPQLPEFSKSNRKFLANMDSIKATQLLAGMVIQHEGDLFSNHITEHRTPGNKRGSMQTRMKNLRTGSIIDYRFRAEEFVERAILDEVEFEYLYSEGDEFYFMNTETYEQMQMNKDE